MTMSELWRVKVPDRWMMSVSELRKITVVKLERTRPRQSVPNLELNL